MTDWPDKDRPGVPLNPDRSGAHMLGSHVLIWRAYAGNYMNANGNILPPEVAYALPYRGPCLTPEEVQAKDARIAEVEAQLAALQRDASQETPADDLVKRLQHLGDWQAADRIEAQAARIAELEAALENTSIIGKRRAALRGKDD